MTIIAQTANRTPIIDQARAEAVAYHYVISHIDPAFSVVNGCCEYSQPHQRLLWSFLIHGGNGPLQPIYIDAQTNQVVAFTEHEIQTIREKAFILQCRTDGLLPIDNDGYVVREFARRQADHYLLMEIGLQALATDGVFIPLEEPIWQFLIEVRLPKSGVVGIFGMLDVDAKTGEVIPLLHEQIQKIWSRASAAAELQTSTFIHDPAFPSGPIEMPLLDFEIGWDEKDRQYAIISLTNVDEA